MEEDTTGPTLVGVPGGEGLDCGEVPDDPAIVTAQDSCGGDLEVEFVESEEEDCSNRVITRSKSLYVSYVCLLAKSWGDGAVSPMLLVFACLWCVTTLLI